MNTHIKETYNKLIKCLIEERTFNLVETTFSIISITSENNLWSTQVKFYLLYFKNLND